MPFIDLSQEYLNKIYLPRAFVEARVVALFFLSFYQEVLHFDKNMIHF